MLFSAMYAFIKLQPCVGCSLRQLKAKKTNGFNSCIVIGVFPLNILSIKKVQNIVIIDELTP